MASVPSPFASFPTCGDENTIDGGRGAGACPIVPARSSARLSFRFSVRPACLPRRASLSHRLILSSVRLIRSPRFVLLAFRSSARLSSLVHRLGSSARPPPASYRPAPRIIDKGGGEIPGSSSAGGVSRLLICVAGGGRAVACLVPSAGCRRHCGRVVIGCRRSSWLLACL